MNLVLIFFLNIYIFFLTGCSGWGLLGLWGLPYDSFVSGYGEVQPQKQNGNRSLLAPG